MDTHMNESKLDFLNVYIVYCKCVTNTGTTRWRLCTTDHSDAQMPHRNKNDKVIEMNPASKSRMTSMTFQNILLH